jgi:glycerol transport system substrate-binding protein
MTGSRRRSSSAKFKELKYGYELGVPVNWSAYEDIAEFFTEKVKEIDGKKVYGHMDYGKKDPVAGLAFHRCLAVHGRCRRQGHPQWPAG